MSYLLDTNTVIGILRDRRCKGSAVSPIGAQVSSLRALPPGWFDSASPAYDPAQLDELASLLAALVDGFRLPVPYVYPTPQGGARVEWSAPRWEVIVSIDLDARTAEVIAAGAGSDDREELSVRLGEPDAARRLGRFLADHVLAE